MTIFLALLLAWAPGSCGAQAVVPQGPYAAIGYMWFNAPCGVTVPDGWVTPPVWDSTLYTNPAPIAQECATLNTTVGAVPEVVAPPSGPATYGVTSVAQNVPLSTIEVSPNGSMLFDFLIGFQDTTNTQFTGKFDASIDIPFDATTCSLANQISGLPTSPDGLTPYTYLTPCLLITPQQYVNAQLQQHAIGWVSYATASMTLYGPTAQAPPNTPSAQIQSANIPAVTTLQVPYATTVSSTVIRVGMRMSEGYGTEMPLSWGCWEGTCNDTDEIQPLYDGSMQGAWLFSQPFTVQIQPAFLVQFDYLPAFILYQPPGDQSTAGFSWSTQYTQQYTAGSTVSVTSTSELDNKTSQDLSFSGSIKVLNYLSEDLGYDKDQSWDNDIKSSLGASYGDSTSSLLSNTTTTGVSTPKLASSASPDAALGYYQQPFWSDAVYFLIHPQFAIWLYPDGVLAQPLGAAPLQVDTVQDFSNCVGSAVPMSPGHPLTYTYSLFVNNQTQKEPPFELQPTDCANILQLDPFWVASSQSATPPMGLPLGNGGSMPMGIRPLTLSNAQVTSFTAENDSSQTFNATVNATESTNQTSSISGGILGYTLGFKPSTTFSNADGQQLQIQLTSKESQQTEQTLTANLSLQDCPLVNGQDTCSGSESAVSVAPFQDERFGTLLAQTPYLSPTKPPMLKSGSGQGPVCIPCLNVLQIIQNETHFAGLSIYNPQAASPGPSSLYRTTADSYGFNAGEVPSGSHLVLDLSKMTGAVRPTTPLAHLQAPAAPRGNRVIVPKTPSRYQGVLPTPTSLVSSLAGLERRFPRITAAVGAKAPAGQVYPRAGALQRSPDGRLQLLPAKNQ